MRRVTRSTKRTCIRGCLAALCALTGFGWPARPAAREPLPGRLITKGPYVQVFGPTNASVFWESPTNHPATLHYGREGALEQTVEAAAPLRLQGVSTIPRTNLVIVQTNSLTFTKTNVTSELSTNVYYLYETVLPRLAPGGSYAYAVELRGARTPVRRFTLLDPGADAIRLVAYGDSRSDPRMHAKLVRRMRAWSPDLVLHTGDLVARGQDYGLWSKEFFDPAGDLIAEVPFFSVLGNHEQDGTNYLAYFHLPGQERWYSFDAGPVHVLALDFHYEKASAAQFQFARDDLLASRAPWKIVFLHYPVFNIGGHMTAWGHKDYLPLFHQAKVDLVLAGHSHLYERFRPVASRAAQDVWPITCITTGGGGASLYPSFDHPALLAQDSANHFVQFQITRDQLKAEAVRVDGRIIDRFGWKKTDGRLPAEYLAQLYPEESLKLVFEVIPSLSGRTERLPTTTEPTTVLLTLAPRKDAAPPAELEIRLAPSSAPYYTLENGPLQTVTPPQGVTNQVIRAVVRATGKKKITGAKGQDLSPALVFQADVKAADGQTVAYGSRTRRVQPADSKTK